MSEGSKSSRSRVVAISPTTRNDNKTAKWNQEIDQQFHQGYLCDV